MRNDFYKDYVRQYSISKTLRFELRPQGRTQEYIEKHGILDEDEARAESYVKPPIDYGRREKFIYRMVSRRQLLSTCRQESIRKCYAAPTTAGNVRFLKNTI